MYRDILLPDINLSFYEIAQPSCLKRLGTNMVHNTYFQLLHDLLDTSILSTYYSRIIKKTNWLWQTIVWRWRRQLQPIKIKCLFHTSNSITAGLQNVQSIDSIFMFDLFTNNKSDCCVLKLTNKKIFQFWLFCSVVWMCPFKQLHLEVDRN